MDAQLQSFVDKMTRSQFADLQGSWANVHLVRGESQAARTRGTRSWCLRPT